MNRQFPETYMPHNYVNICSDSLVIIEVQMKTNMRYHFPPIGWTKIRKLDNAKCQQEFMKRECLYTSGGSLYQHWNYGEQSVTTWSSPVHMPQKFSSNIYIFVLRIYVCIYIHICRYTSIYVLFRLRCLLQHCFQWQRDEGFLGAHH